MMTSAHWKVIFAGDSNVGKSSLLNTFENNRFSKHSSPTIALAHKSAEIKVNNTLVSMHCWDTAGQERFQSLAPMYFRDAILIFLVFDLTNEQSFLNVPLWLEKIKKYSPENVEIILVGNKSDLASERLVSSTDIDTFCQCIRLMYFELSAKDLAKVRQLFHHAATIILQRFPETQEESLVAANCTVSLTNVRSAEKKNCSC